MTTSTTTIIIWVGSAFYYLSVIFLVILWMGDKNIFPSANILLGVHSFSTNVPLIVRRRSIPTITTVDDNEYSKVSAPFYALSYHPHSPLFRTQLSAVPPTTNRVTSSSSSSSSSTEKGETSTSSQTPRLRVVQGIRDVIDDYDVFLLDMWGVMHDGIQPYPGVLDVIQQLQRAGKELVILSNSSKRRDNSVKMLQKLGFDPKDFSQIITSGEVAYQLLLSSNGRSDTSSSSSTSTSNVDSSLMPQPWPVLNDSLLKSPDQRNVFCLGSGDDDEEYLTSCGWTVSSTVSEASLIVARGTFTVWNDDGTVIHKTRDGEELYAQRLANVLDMAAHYQIPMIVANPDKIRPDADRSPMPGTIGDAYERALITQCGGNDDEAMTKAEQLVKRIGKPFPDVYEIALRRQRQRRQAASSDESASSFPASRVCMVGDALETDVTGGTLQGIDTLWVIQDGIHNVAVEEYRQRMSTTTDLDTDSALATACAAVLDEFNQKSRDETTYAKGRQLRPSMVMRHFCW